MYNLERLGVHRWQPEWIRYYLVSNLWEALRLQQYREYVLGKPTRIS